MDYCEENDHGQAAIDQEFEICQEMVRLLPLKIESIKRNLKKWNLFFIHCIYFYF